MTVKIIIEKNVQSKEEGRLFAKHFLTTVNMLDKVRGILLLDGETAVVFYDDSQELTKDFLRT